MLICPHCQTENAVVNNESRAVQCACCLHWFHKPLGEEPPTLLTCQQCGKKCTAYADWSGRCFFCIAGKP